MPAELCTPGSAWPAWRATVEKGKQLQLPPGAGMVPNTTRRCLVILPNQRALGGSWSLHPPASSALQNALRSLGAFHALGPSVFGFLGTFSY